MPFLGQVSECYHYCSNEALSSLTACGRAHHSKRGCFEQTVALTSASVGCPLLQAES